MITAQAADSRSVRALDEARGPGVLILHEGMDDGSSWRRVTARLLDLKSGSACTLADEVEM
jgi:hypothetical protein